MPVSLFQRSPILMITILILAGTFSLLVGYTFGSKTYRVVKQGVHTQGEVVRIEARRDVRSRVYMYTPVFQFQTPDGKTHLVRSSTANNAPRYEEGERVNIVHPPNAPENARIDTFIELWLAPLITGIMGILFIGAGIFQIYRSRSHPSQSQ